MSAEGRWAWVCLALAPVFWFLGVAVPFALGARLGGGDPYGDQPAAVTVPLVLLGIAIVGLPAVPAVVLARRAWDHGDRSPRIAALVLVGVTVLFAVVALASWVASLLTG
ncbi:hypothetical protein GCM10023168_00840 [Fodinibacter luteus]|uniref:Uncharacterized protein n=2 Tax=Fodinibacter luteus TaxID=552064 RepID=A0ABP8JVL1_9MICO